MIDLHLHTTASDGHSTPVELVREAVAAGIDEANQRLARVEQIKKFHIVEGDWLPGGDELTPTMKLKRKPIDQKYSEQIESLYER